MSDVAEKIRYFELDNKPGRALKFDWDLLGANKIKVADQSLFIRKIPTDITAPELHAKFNKYGEIKSLKIALNEDYSSKTYGFVTF